MGAAGEAVVDMAGPQRAAVDESGVRLQQGRTGLDALPRVVRGLDSSGRDEDEAVPYPDVSWARADPYLTQALIGRNLLDMQTISTSPTVTADGVKAVPDQPFTRDLRRRLG